MAEQRSFASVCDRILLLSALLGLSAAGWGLLVWQAVTLRPHTMEWTMGMGGVLFLASWVAMMIAMMVPSAGPMILMFAASSAGKRQRAHAFVSTWVFVSGYLLVWTLFGVVAFVLATAVDQWMGQSMSIMENAGRVGGLVLVTAGLYECSRLKQHCLTKCRSHTHFLVTSWRDGYRGALGMGLEHGVYCLGSCGLLSIILFPMGMMNLAMVGLVTVLIFAEKCLPVGQLASQVAAGALVVSGIVVIFTPTTLPMMMS